MGQAGDKPGHPFRGNQYTYTDRATSDLSIGAGLVRGGPKSKDVIAAYNAAQDAIAPDLNHLAKENKIPADVADVPSGGSGVYSRVASLTTKIDPNDPQYRREGGKKSPASALADAERQHGVDSPQAAKARAVVTERSIRRARANEGMGGTPTPKEGDRVKISDRVVGGGKTGVVVSSHGSFHIVATSKKDLEEGRGHSFHSSDLQTKSGARKRNPIDELGRGRAQVVDTSTRVDRQALLNARRAQEQAASVKVTSGSVKEKTSEGRTAKQWARDEARDDKDTDDYYERTHRFSEEHGG